MPRLTGSLSADCDAQSNESASHIDEPTLKESGGSPRPSSPITGDEGIDLAWVIHLIIILNVKFSLLFSNHYSVTYAEMLPVQETEQDAYMESELVLSQGVFNNSYCVFSNHLALTLKCKIHKDELAVNVM